MKKGDAFLIWGGSGEVGSHAIRLTRTARVLPVAVVSDPSSAEYCRSISSVGVLDRENFAHWGKIPDWRDKLAFQKWLDGVNFFGKAIWDAVGAKTAPRIAIEYLGEQTLATSTFVSEGGGMSVIWGATGFQATLDLRHRWMLQNRLQGPHYATIRKCIQLVSDKVIMPCVGDVLSFNQVPLAHKLMAEGMLKPGNGVIRIGDEG